MSDQLQLEQAIAVQESLRGTIDDGIIDATIAALRAQLAALTPKGAPKSRRAQATILFMDLADHTRLIQGRDPEEIMEIIDRALQRLAEPIGQLGGKIVRYQGDGFKAAFGLPVARENDPDSAVLASLDILATAAEIAAELETQRGLPGFQVRVGIDTGVVLIGGGTEGEDSIAGLTVNLAARLESLAEPGTVLISHHTYQHIRGVFDFEPKQPVMAKGFPEPVPVYRVLGRKARSFRTRRRGVEGVETRMVGRESEFGTLQDVFRRVVENNERRSVIVVGDAGLGKSRLLYEFENWVDLQPVKVQLYRGRAWMETQKLPYGLLRNVFVFRCGIHDDDANPVVRDKLVSAFQGVLGEGLETTRKAHIVGHLIGYDFGTSPYVQPFIGDARQLRSQAMFYLTEFFRAASARGPILFLFEDLHWADDSSLDAIASLEATSAVGQTMILSAARPTLYERRPDWLAYRPGHQRIGLAALDPQASSELVSEVLQKADLIPESLRQLIIARSEGNPYYVEELVKVLVDEGVIVVDGDSWRVNPNRVMSIRVPATLTGLLQSRLENLPEDERGALQRASVVGRLFWDDAVRSVGDEPNDGPLADQMASLQQRELVFLREETAFEGANEFLFKHAMLRDVTYESVLKRLRRVYHRRAAEWLALRAGDRADEYADQIAAHYAEAGDELSEAEWQGRAGKQAARRYATNEAIRALSRALELTPQEDRASRYELLENRCQTFHLLGDRTRQLADLEELERLASEMGEPRRMIQAAASKSMYLLSTGDYEQVLANHRSVDQWLDRADVPSLKAQLHKHSAHALVYLGQYDEAKRYLSLVVELAEEIGDKRTLMDALRVLGIVAEELGDFGAEQKYFLDALQLARELGDRMGERRALNSLGIVAQNIGDYQAALSHYDESLGIARAIGDRTGEGTVLGNIGVMKNHIGDYSGACEMFRQSLAIDGETGNKTGVNVNLLNLAAALTYLEDYDTSLDLLQQAYDGIEKTGDLPLLGHVLNARGMTLLRAGRSKEALVTLRRALDLRMTLGQPHLAIETRALLAESLLQEGRHAEAVAEAETVLLYREENHLLEEASVSWVMMAVYHVLEAAGDVRSAEVLARAHEELQLSADQLDPVSRQSYLQNVAANREIAELWQNQSGK